jgi:hypothetical protein
MDWHDYVRCQSLDGGARARHTGVGSVGGGSKKDQEHQNGKNDQEGKFHQTSSHWRPHPVLPGGAVEMQHL